MAITMSGRRIEISLLLKLAPSEIRFEAIINGQFAAQWFLSVLNFERFMKAQLTPSAVPNVRPISVARGMSLHAGRSFVRPKASFRSRE